MGSVTPVQGQRLVWEITKTHQRPEVPLPRFLADEVARTSRASSRTTWSSPASATTNPCRISTYRTTFRAATTSIGVRDDLHPHQVRHTAASLAIARGADVKVVQQMLGHSSATMTLDTYGHLFEDRLDEVGDAMDRAREAARARRSTCGWWPETILLWPQCCPRGFRREMQRGPAQRFRWSGPLF
jgi:integrase